MKRWIGLIVIAAMLAGMTPNVYAGLWLDNGVQLVNNDKSELYIYGRGQMLGVGEIVPDPVADNQRVYLYLKEARMGFKGRLEDAFKYEIQLGYGGEDANGSNTDMTLLDFVADVPVKPLGENTVLKIGQYRVPFGRESTTDTGYMDWTDRSIANLATYQGRDYGLGLMSSNDHWKGTIGIFSGGGQDVPQRYLPEQIGWPETVVRFGYNDGVDNDLYHVVGTDLKLTRTTKALMVSGLYMQDTRIGHSTALNLRAPYKNLLIDPYYNPYINRGDGNVVCSAVSCERGNYYAVGLDGVIRHPIDNTHAVEGEFEVAQSGYQNRFGVLHIASGRVQGDYQTGPYEIGLRYAILSMDSDAGYISTTPAGPGASYAATAGKPIAATIIPGMGDPIHEITPSLTWHIKGENLKVVASLPIFLNCPLWIDTSDGAYVFADSTGVDQDSVLNNTNNNSDRHTIVEGRMLFQFQF